MSYDVRGYELPLNASAADRFTLSVWKTWVTWLRPLLVATLVMTIVSIVVGTFIAKTGGYVAVWSPADYAPAGPVGDASPAAMGGARWTRGILAQLAAVVAALVAVWPVLRRSPVPGPVGGVAGFLVVAMHVTFSHQWGLQPIVAAPFPYQAAALVALWILPVAAAAEGGFIVSRRRLDR